jgi:hypothetical protein
MSGMSLIESARRAPHRNASIPQVVVGGLVSLGTLLTVQMAALTAYVDVFGGPGGLKAQRYDELGRPFTGFAQVWAEYGPLLWGVYALGLLVGLVLMWRTILTRPPRAGWGYVPVLIAACAVFWVLNADRFLS